MWIVKFAGRNSIPIFTGRIAKVVAMKPHETLAMIEEAAGTKMYELKKEQSVRSLEKKEVKLADVNRQLEESVEPHLEKLKKEKEEFLAHSSQEQALSRIKNVNSAHLYYDASKRLEECESNITKFEESMEKLEMGIKNAEEGIVTNKETTEETEKQAKELESEETVLKKAHDEAEKGLKLKENALKKKEAEFQKMKEKREGKAGELAELNKKVEAEATKMEGVKTELVEISTEKEEIEKKIQQLEQKKVEINGGGGDGGGRDLVQEIRDMGKEIMLKKQNMESMKKQKTYLLFKWFLVILSVATEF